jgi:carnitine 3-dehydrogenase
VETPVRAEWIDYNGHMTDSRYQQVFGDAIDALYQRVGVDDAYRARGHMFYTVESHVRHVGEARLGDTLHADLQVLALDEKRLQVFHSLRRSRDDSLVATAEQMHLHVDTREKRSTAIDPTVLRRLRELGDAHATLPRPDGAGRSIGMVRA